MIFVRPWCYRAYEAYIFGKLADNEPSGCRAVVGVNSRKWGYFRGICARLSAFWLAGGIGPGNFGNELN